MNASRLGLVGYSTRALAEAAFELGFSVAAIDAFGDQDLLDVAECQSVNYWPHDIIDCARTTKCDGWLLAGGMENHGRLVARLADQSPVLGPTREQLMVLRSLRFWRELAANVPGLHMPATFRSTSSPIHHRGLFKPRRSSGGIHVTEATAGLATSQLPRGYWQEFIAGRVLGATTLIDGSGVRFLGATESLSADQWPAPRPYIYRGSLGPVQLRPAQCEALLAMAARVGEQLGYRGYLQADVIEDARGRLWLLELNPRWTAGMEVLHWCAAEPAGAPLAAHLSIFGIGIAPRDKPEVAPPVALAKAILYAPHDLYLSFAQRRKLQLFRQRQPYSGVGWWNIADVPALCNERPLAIATGQPVMTLRFGLNAHRSQYAQTAQTLLAGLNAARAHVMQRVFKAA